MRATRVLAVAALTLLPAAPAAAAKPPLRELPAAGPLPVVPAHVPDRVLAGAGGRAASAPAVRAASAPLVRAARTRSYRTPDGQRVEVAVSASYPEDSTADRALVDFLATRAHGRELGSIRLFVGRPLEVSELCGGGDVVACYSIAEQRMYVPGEDTPAVPMEYVITHEYGHHLASWRSNDPWDALDWGPKHWASAVGVCAAVRRHELFPGNQGSHYFDDPGEGFAEGYAQLHYPQESWRYNELMRPDARVLDAIRRDVVDPWTGPRTRVLRGRRSAIMRLRLKLDGELTLKLAATRGARYQVEARTAAWTARRTLGAGSALGVDGCRPAGADAQTLTLAVRRRSGSGPFRLIVRYPG